MADLANDDLANDDLGSWFDEELSAKPTAKPAKAAASAKPSAKKHCSACGSPLSEGAVLCVACGFDTRSGKKHETTKVVDEDVESKATAAVRHSASLARGAIFSAIGAALGAAIWYVVVLFTGYEIGWIAWGLGFAAGAGMAYGHEDDDGTTAGVIAAGISVLGILAAKFLVFQHLKSSIMDMGGAFAGVEGAEADVALDALAQALDQHLTFAAMFGPIDALFILLAVASAYKIGSGQMTD